METEMEIKIPSSSYHLLEFWDNFLEYVVDESGGWPTDQLANDFLEEYNGRLTNKILYFDSEEDFLLFKLTFS